MTFVQMRAEAELLYESINSSDAPGFTNPEWGRLLTVAQRRVVLAVLRMGVNRNTFNSWAIEKLIQEDSYTTFVNNTHFKNTDGTSAKTLNVAVDTDFFWSLDEYAKTGSGLTEVTNIPLKRISFDFYRINLENPYRKPNKEDGYWILQYDNLPVFITDGEVITGYYSVGVIHPNNYPISSTSDCILNESIHFKIVEEAVTLARMSVVDTNGYQLSLAEFAK